MVSKIAYFFIVFLSLCSAQSNETTTEESIVTTTESPPTEESSASIEPVTLEPNNETESNNLTDQTNGTEEEVAGASILTSVPFKDYEAFCPNDGPVQIFSYKPVRVTNERDALLYNTTEWPSEDMLLKAMCFDLKEYFGEGWVNVSTPECRLGEAFGAGETVWDNDPTYTCKKGEYVNGVSSEYVNGTRMLRIRCCQVVEFERVKDYDCFSVPMDPRYSGLLINQRPNCTVDILSSVTVSRGDTFQVGVMGRYCGYIRQGDQPDPFCSVKRRIELKRAKKLPEPPPEEEPVDISMEELEGVIGPGQKTPVEGPFDFACPPGQAIDRLDAEMAGKDMMFTFHCRNVTGGPQAFQSVRFIDYQPLPISNEDDVSAGCNFRQDEVLCGVKSYVSPNGPGGQPIRLYAFGCCEMANAVVNDNQNEELRFTDLIPSKESDNPEGTAQANGQFLHRIHLEKSPDNLTTVATAWSGYRFVEQTKAIRDRSFQARSSGMLWRPWLWPVIYVLARLLFE